MANDVDITLLIVLDTVRKDRLSIYNSRVETSPGLEQIADESLIFTDAISQAGWTLPSHASMFTGLYPSQHGASEAHPFLVPQLQTLPKLLQECGVSTGCFSANPWLSSYTNLTNGFSEASNFTDHIMGAIPSLSAIEMPIGRIWRAIQEHPKIYHSILDKAEHLQSLTGFGLTDHRSSQSSSYTPRVLQAAKDFIYKDAGDRFLFLNFMDAHLPYRPPQKYWQMFDGGEAYPSDVCMSSHEFNSGIQDISPEEWKSIVGLYDASIRYLDDELQEFFDWLKRERLWNKCNIIITSDHGEMLGEYGLMGHEFGLYEHLINVPLMIKSDEISGGVTGELVELRELFHTILDLHGAAYKELTEGRSLLNLEQSEPIRYSIAERHRPVRTLRIMEKMSKEYNTDLPNDPRYDTILRSIRNKRYKLVDSENTGVSVFDISEGETEIRPTQSRAAQFEKLKKELRNYTSSIDGPDTDQSITKLDDMGDEMKNRLRDLGYLE